MSHAHAADRLVQRWVPVTDATGRTHLEARWVVTAPSAPTAPAPTGSAPHAA